MHVSLTDLAARLDPGRFVRVHRSALVNLDRVREMSGAGDRRLVLVMEDGVEVAASSSGSELLRRLVR